MSIVVNKTRLPVTQWQTESGSVVSISDARKRYAKSLSVALEPIQDLSHGDPSPTNLCPISGRSSVTAVRDGKNLLDTTLYGGCSYNPNVGTDWSGRYVSVNQFTANSDNSVFTVTLGSWESRTMFARVKPSTAYKLKASLSGEDCATTYGWLDENNLVLTKFNTTGATVNLNTTITSPNNAGWFYLLIAPRSRQQTLTFTEPQFEYSPQTNYEPYQGISVTLSLGQTVYGGSVDLVSGVMAVTKKTVDLGSLNWSRIANPYGGLSSTYLFSASLNGEPKSQFTGILSSYKWVVNYIYFNDTGTAGYIYNKNIAIRDDRYTDKDAFKTAVTGQQLCFELGEPIVIQLTAHQIEMLMRNNTVWSDAGLVTLEYARIHQ